MTQSSTGRERLPLLDLALEGYRFSASTNGVHSPAGFWVAWPRFARYIHGGESRRSAGHCRIWLTQPQLKASERNLEPERITIVKIFLALIVILASLSLQAQTNIIYPTAVSTNSAQTSPCGGKAAGVCTYQGGSYAGWYTWNTNSPIHSASCGSNYCVQWLNGFGPNGSAHGTVTVGRVAAEPYYIFATYPTNKVDIKTNKPVILIGFDP